MASRSAPIAMVAILLAGACSSAPPSVAPTTGESASASPPPASSGPSLPPATGVHRIGVRVIDGAGEFYDTVTDQRFVPRGMNYNRFLQIPSGQIVDGVLTTLHYDPATVEADFAAMRALGFNVVRIMLEICGQSANGCIAGPDGRLNGAFIDNLADLLKRAKTAGLFVMVASNTLPDDGYWINATASLADSTFDSANNEFLNPRAVPIYVDYWESLVRALVEHGAPLDAIWAYELRQEHHFHWNYAPLNLASGLVTTANGATYDMSIAADKARMVDEGLVYWADTLRTAIRAIDPTALVTVGFFTPNEPHPVNGPGETRLVRTAYFLRHSSVDFVDLHHYRGNGVDDIDIWENFGIEGAEAMPIVLGEQGAYRDWWSSEDRAAATVLGLEVASCRVGFDGWLVWGWRGDDSRDMWWASEGEGKVARVVAPVERPDPCEYKAFDFIRFNVAPAATVRASSSVQGLGPGHVNDERPDHWNASEGAPQWIELTLEAPTDLDEIRLVVAQDPAGRSVHQIWVKTTGGRLERVHTFDGVTTEGDVLVYSPGSGLEAVEVVRVLTAAVGQLWPAWHEIELLTSTPPS